MNAKTQTAAAKPAFIQAQLKEWAVTNRPLVLAMLDAQKRAASERARVDAYIEPLFQTKSFVDDAGKPIIHSKDLYRCLDDDACAAFYAECDAAHRAHGFEGPEGYSPALMAAEDARRAENAVIDSMPRFIGHEGAVLSLERRATLLGLAPDLVNA